MEFSESPLDKAPPASTLGIQAMSVTPKNARSTLTMDAGGEYAAGATVLAAYWPRGAPPHVSLVSHAGGRRELLIPMQPDVIEKALAILSEWAKLRTGVSASARLLHQRIRAEAARAAVPAET